MDALLLLGMISECLLAGRVICRAIRRRPPPLRALPRSAELGPLLGLGAGVPVRQPCAGAGLLCWLASTDR